MLLLRVLSAMVGIPVIIAAIWFGGNYLFFLVAILIVMGLKEFFNITSAMKLSALPSLGYVGGVIILLTAHVNSSEFTLAAVSTLLIITLILLVLRYPRISYEALANTVLGILYVGLLFSYLVLIRQLPAGNYLLIFLFILNWTSDSAAYFVGKAYGRRKLAPKVSPNKSIEGSIGGIFFTALVAVLLGNFLFDYSVVHLIMLGLIISVFGQLGDLAESALKRMSNIKDSGNIIPGHGGFLDRFDSVLFTAPLLYLYIVVIS